VTGERHHRQIVIEQDQVGGGACHVCRATDRDPGIGGVQRRRTVDPVPQ
jgi:hypothetical protein